eukprot:CAMPEP_0185611606 /NCGR_PEP_ID=MMETSP0436-20130131/14803_1 /TAXON_ID=626734 ORGANISM="Favella taraikaensis, Strain Fe Narragansett Bay" /NCGR_SAMPLE_ID=MMETSP0436 /ASSEMBLY_ACC=CAM_ASM_000390 /LENGTH=53 /DNA_ID=CAMNT_0028244487 /DNA_START=102 /DNA_END=263 /DNA_ORIENTATION=-
MAAVLWVDWAGESEAGSTVIESESSARLAPGKKPRPTTKDSALNARELSGLTT